MKKGFVSIIFDEQSFSINNIYIYSCLILDCRVFFRRTVRQNMTYKPCENPNGCLIMRISRNRCQYCRMQKCQSAGMSRDGKYFCSCFIMQS
ncbi:hypothetical protein KUTeg_002429 [Tegillarca granosa]|uniref:Nuclear receptor domain-containing protein n=1 Tax=Tegillarca granosa TaxID=220873 RepID=A0ABQ9FUA2_TEGGR|nr:hypothetical protein KUTeg_002429 [Tegillarca granosa]